MVKNKTRAEADSSAILNQSKMKNLPKEYAYKFSFQDKQGNEVTSAIKNCWNKQDALKIANNLLANTSDLDIVKIKTKRC